MNPDIQLGIIRSVLIIHLLTSDSYKIWNIIICCIEMYILHAQLRWSEFDIVYDDVSIEMYNNNYYAILTRYANSLLTSSYTISNSDHCNCAWKMYILIRQKFFLNILKESLINKLMIRTLRIIMTICGFGIDLIKNI